MKAFKSLLSATIITTTLAVSMTAEAATRWRLGHTLADDHPVHQGMLYFAEKAQEYTDGEVRIRVYPNGTLGSERESLELLKSGALQMVKVSAASAEAFEPSYTLFNLPYLFSSRDVFYSVLKGDLGQKYLEAPKDKGFIGLTYYDSGARSFYAQTPITKPEDLAGKKIRVLGSPTAVKMVQALGGIPTPMPLGELYTAMQQGVVDGAENSPMFYANVRHFEVTNYISLDEHSRIPDLLLVSTKALERLSPEHQVAVKRAADESMLLVKDKLWPEAEAAAIKVIEQSNAKIVEVDQAPFRERVLGIYDEFRTDNPALADDLDTILAL